MSERAKLLLDMLLLFGGGFAVCLAVTPLIRALARRVGLVDRPDGRRKMHTEAIPVAGGVAVFISSVLVSLLALGRLTKWPESLVGNESIFISLLIASAVLVIVGIVDDARGLRGSVKLLCQLVAVAIVIAGGVRIEGFTVFDNSIGFGTTVSLALTTFWLLGAINSLNLLDGMDGLLGSMGVILCLTIGTLAFLSNHVAAACASVVFAGALLGFLWYNFPPATIFLGDAGSMLIGLVLGTLAIQASLKGAAVGLFLLVLLMTIPIMDTTAAIVRRKLTGRSIYSTDRGHLHHVLMSYGFSNRQVLLFFGAFCAFGGIAAIVSQSYKSELIAVGATVSMVGFLVAFRLFGHSEFQLIKQHIRAFFLRGGTDTGQAHEIKVHLQGTGNWEEIWAELTANAEELKLSTMCLDVNAPALHEGYHARWERPRKESQDEKQGFWRVEVPLSARDSVVGRLEVIGLRDGTTARHKLTALAELVEAVESAIEAMHFRDDQPPRAV